MIFSVLFCAIVYDVHIKKLGRRQRVAKESLKNNFHFWRSDLGELWLVRMKKAFLALKPSSGAVGNPEWIYPPLAVRFKGEFPGAQSRNNQGVIQSFCTKCGECDIGCSIYAKNTLDLNYIARGRKPGSSGQ